MKDLAHKIKKYWRVLKHLYKMNMMNRLAYTANFFVMCVGIFIQMSLSIIFIKTIFGFIKNLAGWGYYEALLIVASYMIIDGLMWVGCAYLSALSHYLRMGKMDAFLVKPIDSQYLISVFRGDIEDINRLIVGISVFIYALNHLNLGLVELIIRIPIYAILIINGFLMFYSITLVLCSAGFWIIRTESFSDISHALIQISQYPTNIFYHFFVRLILSTIIPVAFMATVPAKILAYGFNSWWLIPSSFLLAAIFFYGSRKFWLLGLKNYSSGSS